ncbi:MAG: cyclic nucleotide-binding domain-containing protein [Alphaproteobacteria bacterium]|nr:cyclic nucleotide-binding domain-containing protein [Alphaproteobacteria bacterium]
MSVSTFEDGLNCLNYKKGQVIFEEGDAANSAFMILSGSVMIVKRTAAEDVLLTTLKANQAFGELALIDGTKRSATAIAALDTKLAVVPAAKFQAKMDALDPFMRAWVQFLKHRILDLSSRVAE